MVDSLRSNREEEGEEEIDEAEQGFIMEKVDQEIVIVPSKSPVYDNLSPAGESVDPTELQLKALYEGEGVSPPHYDERLPIDGAESEAGDEEEEIDDFHQQNFVSNDLMFTQARPFNSSENRDTIDLAASRANYQVHHEEEGEEEQREAEEQF